MEAAGLYVTPVALASQTTASIFRVPDGDDVNTADSSGKLAPTYNSHGVTSQKTPTGKLVFKMTAIWPFETAVQLSQQSQYSWRNPPPPRKKPYNSLLYPQFGGRHQVAPKRPYYIHVVTSLRCEKASSITVVRACVRVCQPVSKLQIQIT